ncbi:MAG: cytochrome c oxidase accessory protein CcoG [Bacteroidetes bacterium]|nr:cytochrome c oxidase accessory protein CcoG [Bacteroidota bacterium]
MNTQDSKEGFRDILANVTEDGDRKWIYPKKPSGKFYNARTAVSIILLLFLFGAPFLKVNGHPFLLFNILERKFVLFGILFGPHDFYIFVLLMISVFVSIFLFTVVYGRLFCGWVCPQTIFLEMVFRKIEYFIEGDASKQKRLDTGPMTKEKIFKKSVKHIIFMGLSFIISNTFLAYIIGVDSLFQIITDPPSQHLGGLAAISIFSGIFYFVFSSFREQACVLVCPYGRLQSVMLDANSIVIAYDNKRGEPRGKIKKDVEQSNGDCIDCHLCVDVCPTGIDIRNGTQLECVNCTACIDECNTVMSKVKRPKGLIRYASKIEIETGKRFIFTPRAIGYTIVLIILFSITSFMMINRNNYEISLLRTPGLLSQPQLDNKISNLYDLKVVNKTFEPLQLRVELVKPFGEIKVLGSDLLIEPQATEKAKLLVVLSLDIIKSLKTELEINVYSNNELTETIKTSFLGKIENRTK